MRPADHRQAGFTLLELLVVIAIIAILAAALMGATAGARKAAQCVKKISELKKSLRKAIDKMKAVRDGGATLDKGLDTVKDACVKFRGAKNSKCYTVTADAALDALLRSSRS